MEKAQENSINKKQNGLEQLKKLKIIHPPQWNIVNNETIIILLHYSECR